MAWWVGWLVPATACALFTFSVFNSANEIPGRTSHREPMVTTLLSNQSYLVCVPDSFQKGQNNLSSVTFDLTNRSGATSRMYSFPRSRMN
jgi:hypothetical protein